MANIDIFSSNSADSDGINSVFTEGGYARVGIRRVDDWSTASYVEFKANGMGDDFVYAPKVQYSNGQLAAYDSYTYNSSTGVGAAIIPAGVRGVWIYFYVTDDSVYEGDEEFTFELTDAGSDTIVEQTQTFTINDNDPEPIPTPTLSLHDGGFTDEGNDSGSYAQLSHEASYDVTFEVSTDYVTYQEANAYNSDADYNGQEVVATVAEWRMFTI